MRGGGSTGLKLRHAVKDLLLQVVAVGHRHQAGLPLGEAVARTLLVLHIKVGGGKFSFTSPQDLRHLLKEVRMGKFRLARFAGSIDELHHLHTGHCDFGGVATGKRLASVDPLKAPNGAHSEAPWGCPGAPLRTGLPASPMLATV